LCPQGCCEGVSGSQPFRILAAVHSDASAALSTCAGSTTVMVSPDGTCVGGGVVSCKDTMGCVDSPIYSADQDQRLWEDLQPTYLLRGIHLSQRDPNQCKLMDLMTDIHWSRFLKCTKRRHTRRCSFYPQIPLSFCIVSSNSP
jgi:hypothetical protein